MNALEGEKAPSAAQYLVISTLTQVPVPVLVGAVDPATSVGVALRAGILADPATDAGVVQQRGVQLVEAARLVTSWLGADALGRADLLARLRRMVSRHAYAPRAGQRTAEQVRAMMARLGLGDPDAPIEDIAGLIESLGVPVELSDRLPEGLHGVTVHDQSRGSWEAAVVIRVHDRWARQRYTLAHELCHVLYQDSAMVFINDRDTEQSQVDVERRAEHFARHFLVPSSQARRIWNSYRGRGESRALCEFMLYFGISRQAAVITLRDLGLVDQEQAERLHAANVAAMMNEAGLGHIWSELNEAQHEPSASVWLLQASLELFEQGLVPVAAVASILDADEAETAASLADRGWLATQHASAAQAQREQTEPGSPL
ncbi:ImmA/IrrE family metallo-endopeptidase [Actinoplanes sp. NPDC051343]|uniref:ImmA/IrrE family metallo-endopeptidase n=1 Tax=Actinoplanes sp. NPDC051343 TaxID=3363906 RepID=UPI00379EAF10